MEDRMPECLSTEKAGGKKLTQREKARSLTGEGRGRNTKGQEWPRRDMASESRVLKQFLEQRLQQEHD